MPAASVPDCTAAMRRSSLFGHIIEILDQMRVSRLPADRLLVEFFRSRHYLGSSDRRFVADTFFGILRHYAFLRHLLRAACAGAGPGGRSPAEFPPVAYCAAYGARFLGTGRDALVADLLASWRIAGLACDLTSAVASLSEDPSALLPEDPVQRIAIEHSFPEMIVREWSERFGRDETGELCRALNAPAPITIRVNTLKTTVEQCAEALLQSGVRTTPGRVAPQALVLEKRVNAQAFPAYRQGFFEMQDEGSQLISLLLSPKPGELVVDACAGGGGKSLHCAALMENRGKIVAIDIDDTKLRTLSARALRAGISIVHLLSARRNKQPIDRLAGSADAVLVDAPCSGVGTFRRNPWLKRTLTDRGLQDRFAPQRLLLDRYAGLVKPGGRLVYATCTLLRRENEEVVSDFLDSHPEFRLVPAQQALDKHSRSCCIEDVMLLLPHRTTTDGFFAALLSRSL